MSSYLSESGLSHYDEKIKQYISSHSGGEFKMNVIREDTTFNLKEVGEAHEIAVYSASPLTFTYSADGGNGTIWVLKHNDSTSTVYKTFTVTTSRPTVSASGYANGIYTIIRVA